LFHLTHRFEGISRAHKQIVKWAKNNKLPCVCIAEDDFYITAKGGWEYFIQNIPSNYDLYLSSVYFGHIEEDGTCKDFCGFTLYMVHERFYETFLSTPNFGNIDRSMAKHKGVYKVCVPFIALQRDGMFSDNKQVVTNYKRHLKGRKIFGKSPDQE